MNPIIRRELFALLRQRRVIALQLLLALACGLLVLLRWPTGELADLSGGRSQEVLRLFAYGLLACMLLVVPAFPATSLVREKMKGTLALLLNSPLSPWSIYLGKLAGVLGFSVILLLMTVPAAAACYALGGMGSQGGILALYGLLGVALLQLSTLGLLVSSRCHTTDGALRLTYALVLALSVLTLAPHALLRGGTDPLAQAAEWLRCLSPIPPVLEIMGHGQVGTQGLGDPPVAGRYALLGLLLSAGFAVATVARLNHRLLDRARPAGIMTEDRSAQGRLVRRLFFLVDPQRRSGAASLWLNPVLVKEFRSRRFGRWHWTLRLLALSAILSLGLSTIATTGALGWGIETVGAALVLFQAALLVLFTPSLAAGLISAEREGGTWLLLRMTPLSSGSILRAKLLSVAWPLFLILCATLPGYVVLMTIQPELIPQVQRVLICLGMTALFCVLLSAAVGSLFRAAATATTAAYVLLLAICVGPLLVWLAREAPFGRDTVRAALLINPVAATLQAAETPGFTQYELLPLNWWICGAACVVLLVFLHVRVWQLVLPE
jgi:ABC-type transport system involved in multi-copper enzyme maturation permease subunit